MVTPQQPMHAGKQLFIFIGLSAAIMVGCALLGLGIISAIYGIKGLQAMGSLSPSTPNGATMLWILQICSSTLPLLWASVVFGFVVVKQPKQVLKANMPPSLQEVLLIVGVMLLCIPFMEWLINFNQHLKLPAALKGIDDWMREKEAQAATEMQVLLQMKTVGQLLFNVLMVGLATAIAEEFFFRGCLQSIFTQWLKNHHYSILLTAAIFSAIHLEFLGFLPRMALGMFFGYFVHYSRSIWTGVLGHFINNGGQVLMLYFYQRHTTHVNPDGQYTFSYPLYVFSLLSTIFLIWFFARTQQPIKNSRV